MPQPVPMLQLRHETTLFGPNPFATGPVIVARIGVSEGNSSSDDAWTQGCRVLRDCFPEWVDASPASPQHPMARVGRTAARWALAALNETDGFLHDAGAVPVAGEARIWLGFHHPDVSLLALRTALTLLAEAAHSRQIDRGRADTALESIWQLCRHHHPDDDARILMRGARALDIPILQFISGNRFWQYGWGCRSRVFMRTSSNADGHLGGLLARSKIRSKTAFTGLGLPTPDYRTVTKVEDLGDAIEAVKCPCVVKPVSAIGGRGVTVGVRTLSEAEAAFAIARRYGEVMVEAFVPGDDYRLMVIEGQFFRAVRRQPSSVTGDGASTIAELIAALNTVRSRNEVKSRYIRLIVVDDVVEQHLERQGVSVDTVLAPGRRIVLRGNANRQTGGVCFDVTGEVHPHTRQMVETASRTIGLATAGFDFVTPDIGKPWHECGALLEVNTTPSAGLLIAGGLQAVAVASAILGSTPARVPVRLVVAPRSELPHLLDHLRGMPPAEGFGWACDGAAAIAGMPLRLTASGPWQAVTTLLHHNSLRQACVVCPAEAIVRNGMPVDKVESTTLYRCDTTLLPAAWMKVVTDHSGTVGTCSDWTDLRLADFSMMTLS